MNRRYISLALALILALTLCACGGGEGGKSGDDRSSGGDISQGSGIVGQGDVGKQDAPKTPDTPDAPAGLNIPAGPSIPTLLAGWGRTCAGVLPDGTLIGMDDDGAIEFPESWNDIIAMDLKEAVFAVVHANGTVSSIRLPTGEISERDWTDVMDLAVCRSGMVVGLKSDGTVVSDFSTSTKQYFDLIAAELSGWTDIIAVDGGDYNVFGLRSDGTVVATGFYSPYDADRGQTDVGDWTDIVAISAGDMHTVGLKTDGTVVACGNDTTSDACKVQDWTDIALIAAGRAQTVGVKTDGSVVMTGIDEEPLKVLGWADADAVAVDCDSFTVVLFSDGRVENSCYRDCLDTSVWPALKMPDWYK